MPKEGQASDANLASEPCPRALTPGVSNIADQCSLILTSLAISFELILNVGKNNAITKYVPLFILGHFQMASRGILLSLPSSRSKI